MHSPLARVERKGQVLGPQTWGDQCPVQLPAFPPALETWQSLQFCARWGKSVQVGVEREKWRQQNEPLSQVTFL